MKVVNHPYSGGVATVFGSKEAAENMKRRLNAQKPRSKRSKAEARVVGRRKPEITLEARLCANMKKVLLSLGASLETVPSLSAPGVLCRADGAIFLPASGVHKAHWTFGAVMGGGYRETCFNGKFVYVHRLICEAFHGLCPPGKTEVDHINRDKSDNRPENLRWTDRRGNLRNTRTHDGVSERNSPHTYEDLPGYLHAYYLSRRDTPEYKAVTKAAHKRYRETHHLVRFSDGKARRIPEDEASKMMKLSVEERIWYQRNKAKKKKNENS